MKRIVLGLMLVLLVFCSGCAKENKKQANPSNQAKSIGLELGYEYKLYVNGGRSNGQYGGTLTVTKREIIVKGLRGRFDTGVAFQTFDGHDKKMKILSSRLENRNGRDGMIYVVDENVAYRLSENKEIWLRKLNNNEIYNHGDTHVIHFYPVNTGPFGPPGGLSYVLRK